MSTTINDKSDLLISIIRDSEKDAEKIIADAEKSAEEKNKVKISMVASILKNGRKKAENQIEMIKKNNLSAVSVEEKRIALKVREKIIDQVIEKIKIDIAKLVDSAKYPEIIEGWLIEAALGLGEEEVEVNGSVKELDIMTPSFLKGVQKKYKDLTGRRIVYKKTSSNPLLAQGIVLTSLNRKTAFNNQVPTRLLRYQSEIRKAIYDKFFLS